jgi:hypothetical protein
MELSLKKRQMNWVCREKGNHINSLITRKDFKENKKINIYIIREEYGILINIHGMGNRKTIIQYDIIKNQQLLQIG